jgi:hypothetical protein
MVDRAGGKMPAFLGGIPVTDPIPPAALVREHLDRIVRSPAFAKANRLQAFLRFVVEQTLAGRQDTIKEYAIALEVCGRPATFDAKTDPIEYSDGIVPLADSGSIFRINWRCGRLPFAAVSADPADLVRSTGQRTARAPSPLFATRVVPNPNLPQYAVTPDGKRFLALDAGEGGGDTFTFLLNRFRPGDPAAK